MDNKTVVDRLDSLEFQNEEILKILQEIINKDNGKMEKANTSVSVVHKTDTEIMREFLKKSVKTYIWFGDALDFKKDNLLYTVFALITLGFGLISTILTSLALHLYSTFTLFENIWIIIAFVSYLKSRKLERRMKDTDLMNISYENFKMNDIGLYHPVKEKKRYKVFRVISYISFACNILYLLINKDVKDYKGIAVIFELLTFGSCIAMMFFRLSLFCQYGSIVMFTGLNARKEKVSIVYDMINKKYCTYEDFCKNPIYQMIL